MYRTISECLAISDPTDATIAIGDIVHEKLDTMTLEELSQEEQAFLLVYWMSGQIGNGGFAQFFFNSTGEYALETLDALLTVGATGAAALLQRVVDLFPGGQPSRDEFERNDVIDTWSDKEEALLNEVDDAFLAQQKALDSLLVQYVRDHQGKFDP